MKQKKKRNNEKKKRRKEKKYRRKETEVNEKAHHVYCTLCLGGHIKDGDWLKRTGSKHVKA